MAKPASRRPGDAEADADGLHHVGAGEQLAPVDRTR